MFVKVEGGGRVEVRDRLVFWTGWFGGKRDVCFASILDTNEIYCLLHTCFFSNRQRFFLQTKRALFWENANSSFLSLFLSLLCISTIPFFFCARSLFLGSAAVRGLSLSATSVLRRAQAASSKFMYIFFLISNEMADHKLVLLVNFREFWHQQDFLVDALNCIRLDFVYLLLHTCLQ